MRVMSRKACLKNTCVTSVAFAARERFGDVEVVGADALVGVEDVEFAEDADRGVRVVRPDTVELPLSARAHEVV